MSGLDILIPPVILLAAGFFVIMVCRYIRVSPMVGFLLAGIALGPHGFNVIEESHTTHILAELGVVFLLFDIGLHFSFKSAWGLRKDMFGLAPLQMLLSGLIIGGACAFIFATGSELALLIGLTLALSSTAVVMQILADKKQTESPVGQSAKAVLIFQDLAAIFLLIFADSVGGDSSLASTALFALLNTGIAVVAAIVLGQYILAPLMKMMTRYDDPEMFMMLGLLVVMLTGLATASVGLSLTLGAFLAGMVLAETPFRILLQSELRPFRSLLLAFFFITIGMMLNPLMILDDLGTILSIALMIIATKGALIGALAYLFNRPAHHVIQLAFLLCQGSEFAFVIFSMGNVEALVGTTLAQHLITAVAFSMMASPFLYSFAYKLSIKVCSSMGGVCNSQDMAANPKGSRPVFILGMNETGKTLARAFKAHHIPYIAVDYDRQRFLEAIAAGYIVAYGKPGDMRFWNTLGVGEARAFCSAVALYDIARDASPTIQRLWPNLARYVAVTDSADAVKFAALGLKPFHSKGAPPGLEMATFLLQEFGVSETKIENWCEDEQAHYLKVHGKLPKLEEENSSEAKVP